MEPISVTRDLDNVEVRPVGSAERVSYEADHMGPHRGRYRKRDPSRLVVGWDGIAVELDEPARWTDQDPQRQSSVWLREVGLVDEPLRRRL
jgi:hypothetical protein